MLKVHVSGAELSSPEQLSEEQQQEVQEPHSPYVHKSVSQTQKRKQEPWEPGMTGKLDLRGDGAGT